MTGPIDPRQPCPHCGREDPREVWQQRMAQERAKTLLVSELAAYDLSTIEKSEILAGVRLLADVLGEHDKHNASQEGPNQ